MPFPEPALLSNKGLASGSITAPAVGAQTITFSSTPSGLKAMQPLYLGIPGNAGSEAFVVGPAYAGGTSVPILGQVATGGQTTAYWDVASLTGLGTGSTFTPGDVPLNAQAMFNPTTGFYQAWSYGDVQKGSAGFLGAGQTAKQFVITNQVNSTSVLTTVNLYTVTSGKTFYITDVVMSTEASQGATTQPTWTINAAGVAIWNFNGHGLNSAENPGIETQPFATSGQAVTLTISATPGGVCHSWGFVYGFEQ